ncbi:MAG: hypothetical protein ACYTEU_14560, partial [Planctomycetota bacterium]
MDNLDSTIMINTQTGLLVTSISKSRMTHEVSQGDIIEIVHNYKMFRLESEQSKAPDPLNLIKNIALRPGGEREGGIHTSEWKELTLPDIDGSDTPAILVLDTGELITVPDDTHNQAAFDQWIQQMSQTPDYTYLLYEYARNQAGLMMAKGLGFFGIHQDSSTRQKPVVRYIDRIKPDTFTMTAPGGQVYEFEVLQTDKTQCQLRYRLRPGGETEGKESVSDNRSIWEALRRADELRVKIEDGNATVQEVVELYEAIIQKCPDTKYELASRFGIAQTDKDPQREQCRLIIEKWPDVVTHSTIYARNWVQKPEKWYQWLKSITDEQINDGARNYFVWPFEPTEDDIQRSVKSMQKAINLHIQTYENDPSHLPGGEREGGNKVDKQKVYLPDLESKDAKTVLDLASGQMLSAEGMGKDRQYFKKLGEGDLVYEYAQNKSGLLCLRGATMQIRSDSGLQPTTPEVQRAAFDVYFLKQVPCQYQVTTAEGHKYEIKILSIKK